MIASVIVPARDARRTLQRTLEALARQQTDADYEVIVVDDGSTDNTFELARSAPGPVKVIKQGPAGPGAARNAGVAEARGSALAFCDADVFPVDGWLQAGLDALQDADLVQGRVLPDPSVRLGPFDRTIWTGPEGGLWEAANMFVSRELFDRVGGFPDGIHPRRGKPLAEDVLFGYRAVRLGARAPFADAALAHHAVFPRGAGEYVAERLRLAHFPAMARSAPELRERFLYRRMFLDGRTARLDLALAAAALAVPLRSRLPLLAALPYLVQVRARARRSEAAWSVAALDVAADLLGAAALAAGSVRHRSLVL
jgi:glycosyltransferase involved in cell wall biosynthesis